MDNKTKKILTTFAIRVVITVVCWFSVYYGFIKPDGRVNGWLTTKVVQGTSLGLDLLGHNVDTSSININNQDISGSVFIDGEPVVLVADECNGLELMALYIGFFLCFPGPWRFKSLFIPFGTIMVFLINIVREIVLALNYKYFQETFHFNHKYTYVLIVYLSIFWIWRFWLNRYSIYGRYIRNAQT